MLAHQKGPMALSIRTIGIVGANVKIGLANLTYNIKRRWPSWNDGSAAHENCTIGRRRSPTSLRRRMQDLPAPLIEAVNRGPQLHTDASVA